MSHSLPKTLKGVVRPQWVRCGKPTCRCARGALHGPYYYRFWREHGRLRKQYVCAAEVNDVRAACAERLRMQSMHRASLRLAVELKSNLRNLVVEFRDG
jgi:hypothetical protein